MISTRIAAAAAAGVLATTGAAATTLASAAGATTVPACGNHAIEVSATRGQGATGHADFVLRFRNASHHTCSLSGYPGLDAIGKYGKVLRHAKRTVNGFTGGSHHGVRTIVIRPRHDASADVEWLNFNPRTGGECRFSHYVATTPANTTHTVYLTRAVSLCGLEVHPTVAGKSGSS